MSGASEMELPEEGVLDVSRAPWQVSEELHAWLRRCPGRAVQAHLPKEEQEDKEEDSDE